MDIQVGDILTLKKQHPCGSREWEVLRSGADFRLRCTGCGHQIMIPRRQAEKNVREIRKNSVIYNSLLRKTGPETIRR